MKFLCVKCDEKMILKGAEGSDDGSVGLVLECSNCGNETAMLANPMEAQLVKSLGVSVGGRESEPHPMEMVNNMLTKQEYPPTANGDISWDVKAEERLLNVPEMARPMARMAIERHARSTGISLITTLVMDEAKERFE